uniref:Tick transposon n=1 Tax=Rhipicephalus zambeziensis TaxID=60191 RepID=A0A224Y772_9ACAR
MKRGTNILTVLKLRLTIIWPKITCGACCVRSFQERQIAVAHSQRNDIRLSNYVCAPTALQQKVTAPVLGIHLRVACTHHGSRNNSVSPFSVCMMVNDETLGLFSVDGSGKRQGHENTFLFCISPANRVKILGVYSLCTEENDLDFVHPSRASISQQHSMHVHCVVTALIKAHQIETTGPFGFKGVLKCKQAKNG